MNKLSPGITVAFLGASRYIYLLTLIALLVLPTSCQKEDEDEDVETQEILSGELTSRADGPIDTYQKFADAVSRHKDFKYIANYLAAYHSAAREEIKKGRTYTRISVSDANSLTGNFVKRFGVKYDFNRGVVGPSNAAFKKIYADLKNRTTSSLWRDQIAWKITWFTSQGFKVNDFNKKLAIPGPCTTCPCPNCDDLPDKLIVVDGVGEELHSGVARNAVDHICNNETVPCRDISKYTVCSNAASSVWEREELVCFDQWFEESGWVLLAASVGAIFDQTPKRNGLSMVRGAAASMSIMSVYNLKKCEDAAEVTYRGLCSACDRLHCKKQ